MMTDLDDRALRQAGIPKRFRGKTLGDYHAEGDRQQRALDWALRYREGVPTSAAGAILVGKPGTGKTHLACAVAQHVMETMPPLFVEATAEYVQRVYYTTVMDAVLDLKSSWDSRVTSEADVRHRLTGPRLLVLDEIGGHSSGSDFELNLIFSVINDRYENGKPTVLISNLPMSQLREFLGERTIDRFREDGSDLLNFDWASHRGRP